MCYMYLWLSRYRQIFFWLVLFAFALSGYGFENDFLTRNDKIKIEADYILQCQYLKPGHAAHGAINTIYGEPGWIVPEQNALAILGLVSAAQALNDPIYMQRAQMAADFLTLMQDHRDGAWFDQYCFTTPSDSNKSVRQTAKVMLALFKLGYLPDRYPNMKQAAQYLLTCQAPESKSGTDDGLLCEGKNNQGKYRSWRWTHDNAFGYWALKAAQEWAAIQNDSTLVFECGRGAAALLNGIDEFLYNFANGLWHIAVDEMNTPLKNPHLLCLDNNADIYSSWIQFAPQLLDLPARGVNSTEVGDAIRAAFYSSDSVSLGSMACECKDGDLKLRRYPRNSFIMALSWFDTGHESLARLAINWAENSPFWQKNPDFNGISGGWIHWSELKPEPGQSADWWLRFIDTSFYSIACWLGGYDFSCTENEKLKYSALNPGYSLK